MLSADKLAQLFHDTYEEVLEENALVKREWIPSGSRGWDEIPVIPRRVFIQVCQRILDQIDFDDQPIKPKRKY